MYPKIRQLEEKNVANEINHMVWSNRMDLVALSNVKGEVTLHRLTWTKAWSLAPPKDNCTVDGIAWRPDGKVLAIAYNNGNILLINVETRAIILSFEVPGEVSYISWVQEKTEAKFQDIYNSTETEHEILKSIDLSKPYLKDPPPVSHLEGSINFEDIKGLTSFLQDQSEFNLLVVGTKQGFVQLRVFGCWKCLNLRVTEYIGHQCSVENVHFTEDLSKLLVTVKHEDNITTVLYKSTVFKTHNIELYQVTMKYIKLYELILYLTKILTNITETWESILLEFDQKLSKYASRVPEGGVTADFLELLMFGTFTEQMEEFLIHDLTKKGLEKFGQTMEISYSNIQSYLFRHIIKFAQNGTYHLGELKGMSNFEERYGVIGLDSGQIQKAIRSNGAFVIKASEMQQIINHSVINYKAFFRWLYASIMRLMEEQVPSDIQKMTQQNLSCIAEFLQHFDNYGSGYRKGSTFIMERIGQYMVDSDLTIKPDMTGNEWTQLLEENHCLKMHEGILQHYLDKSLIQVFNEMKKNVEGVFETPTEKISQQLTPIGKFLGMSIQPNLPKPTSFNTSNNTVLMATQSSSRSIYLFDVGFGADSNCQIRCGNIFFTDHALYESNFDDAFKVVDAKFYSSSILSVLLQDTSRPDVSLIVQLLLVPLLKQLKEIDTSININEQSITQIDSRLFGQDIMKYLDMPVSAFSVSGSRRVCIVLGETKRKIKLYEMECEEDEEEDTEMTSMVKDESMQDSYSMASGE